MRDLLQLITQTLPPWSSLWRCGLTGAFGIASGFAVFLLWLDHISHGPVRFVVALGVAVLVAFAFESLKEELEGHEHRWQAPRLLVLVVLLTVAELFIMGFHSTVELTPARLHETLETLLGSDVARWHVMGVVGVWLVLGGAIAVGLGATIFNAGCEIPEGEPLSWRKPAVWGKPMLRSALRGGLTGAIAGPVCMLLYIFAVRFVLEYVWIVEAPGKWKQHLQGAAEAVSGPGWTWLVWVPIQAIRLLDGAFGVFGRVGPLLTLATLVALLVVCAWRRAGRTFVVVLAAVVLVYVYPVLAESARALRLAGLMAYVWAVPGVLLGALTPWLKRPAGYPKLWGVVAFGAAGILVIGSVAIPWFIAPAVVFGAVGFWFQRGVQVEQYWAVLALSVATNIFGATHLVTRADFFHIQRDSFELTKVPLQVFAYQAVKVDPGLDDALRKALDPGEFMKRQLADPSLLRSPFSGVPLSRDRYPWAQVKVPPEVQLAADLEAIGTERGRTASVAAGFAQRLEELDAMKSRVDQDQKSIAELKTLEYHEHHKKLKELAARTSTAIARRESLTAEAATALEEEGKRTIPGRAPHAGEATPGVVSRLEALRDAQLLLQSDRHKLLTTVRQVQERATALRDPLAGLKGAVEGEAADLHNMALRAFQVSLTASSGFWITLGLLASWSIRRPRTTPDLPQGRAHTTSA